MQPYLLIYLPTRPYMAYAFTLLSLLQFQIRFAYGILWNTPFRRVTTHERCARYHTDLGALIAEPKWLDKSFKLRVTVAETTSCGFQRPLGQGRVATPTNEKSYGLEIYELHIQKRQELSTQSRLTVAQKIPSWSQRPTSLETLQRISQSKSLATNSTYKKSKATNRHINDIW